MSCKSTFALITWNNRSALLQTTGFSRTSINSRKTVVFMIYDNNPKLLIRHLFKHFIDYHTNIPKYYPTLPR